MDYEVKTRFVVTGFHEDPDALSRDLGLEPAKTWRIGDQISVTARRFEENGWRLDSSEPPSATPECQIMALLSQLEPVASVLKERSERCYLEFSFIVYAYRSVPELHFGPETLRRVADLGASIDIDLYCLPDEE